WSSCFTSALICSTASLPKAASWFGSSSSFGKTCLAYASTSSRCGCASIARASSALGGDPAAAIADACPPNALVVGADGRSARPSFLSSLFARSWLPRIFATSGVSVPASITHSPVSVAHVVLDAMQQEQRHVRVRRRGRPQPRRGCQLREVAHVRPERDARAEAVALP